MSNKNAIILGVGVKDNVSEGINKITSRMRAWGRNMSSVGSEMTQGLTFPIVAASAALLKFTGDLDAMKKALSVTMGSVAKAEQEFKALKKSAEVPGMGLEEALKGSLNLQALGASAADARFMMEQLAKGVALSGGGQWEFDRVMTQFIQMVGNGKILQEDLKFMFAAAPQLRSATIDAFGTSDPETLRGMMTASEFVTGLIQQLAKMPGVTDSVKNSMENVWTSLRVGAGEIGAAILGAGSWEEAIQGLSATIDKLVEKIVDWINRNRESIKTWSQVIAGIAVVGPVVRAVGNFTMLFSIMGKIVGTTRTLLGLFDKLGPTMFNAGQKGSRGMSMLGGGIRTAAGLGLLYGAGQLMRPDEEGGQAIYNFDKERQAILEGGGGFGKFAMHTLKGMKEAIGLQLNGEFGTGIELWKHSLFGKRGIGASSNLKDFNAKGDAVTASLAEALDRVNEAASRAQAQLFSAGDFMNDKPADGPKDKSTDWLGEYEEGLKRLRIEWGLGGDATELLENRLSLMKDTIIGMELDGKADQVKNLRTEYMALFASMQQKPDQGPKPDNPFMAGVFGVTGEGGETSDMSDHPVVKALEEYEMAMGRVSLAQKMGADTASLLDMNMDALKQGLQSLSAAGMENTDVFDDWLEKYKQMAEAQKEVTAEQERQQKAMNLAMSVMGSVEEAFSGVFEGGKKGAETFSKALRGAISQLMKMVLISFIQKAITAGGGILAPIAIAAGGGVLLAGMNSLLGKVSLAKGGIVSGETLIRAGEYPGAKANPEVIAPINTLKKHLGGMGMGGELSARVAGDDLHFILRRAEYRANRVGGPSLA